MSARPQLSIPFPGEGGHLRHWDPVTAGRAGALYSDMIRQRQDVAPGELMRRWDRELLYQLPETYADLDARGKLIFHTVKAMYHASMLKLKVMGSHHKFSYDTIDRFIEDQSFRGNPVFGDLSQERVGGHHLPNAQRCFYNRYGMTDKFGLSPGTRGRFGNLAADTVRISEQTGVSYSVGAHLYHSDLISLAMEPEIVNRVSSLLGDNVVLLTAHTFTKKPGSPATPYHHGTSYQPIENVLTVFLALTDARPDNGCLSVIPGSEFFAGEDITAAVYRKANYSHLAADLTREERDQLALQIAFTLRGQELGMLRYQTHANFSMLSARIKLLLQNRLAREEISRFRSFRMELDPFEGFIFSERNIHNAGPNNSSRVRCSLALRFAKGDVLIDDTRHLKSLQKYGTRKLTGLDSILKGFVKGRMNAVIQVAGDPEASRRAGNNVIEPEELKRRIAQERM